MPVAALYEIHGNLPALEAVLDEIHQLDVDRIVIGGDVLPGEQFAATNILQPPSEAEMLDLFARAQLK